MLSGFLLRFFFREDKPFSYPNFLYYANFSIVLDQNFREQSLSGGSASGAPPCPPCWIKPGMGTKITPPQISKLLSSKDLLLKLRNQRLPWEYQFPLNENLLELWLTKIDFRYRPTLRSFHPGNILSWKSFWHHGPFTSSVRPHLRKNEVFELVTNF